MQYLAHTKEYSNIIIKYTHMTLHPRNKITYYQCITRIMFSPSPAPPQEATIIL